MADYEITLHVESDRLLSLDEVNELANYVDEKMQTHFEYDEPLEGVELTARGASYEDCN